MIILHSHLKSCRPKIPVIILLCVVYMYFCCPALARSNVSNVNSIIQCPDREREALLQFKHGIKNDYCGLLTSWGGNADCCQWRGVLCSNHTGHVITLRLVGKAYNSDCLDGKVSPSLGELKHLTHLNLSFNDFSQPIPSFLGSLKNLELLSFSYSFKGDIPHQLGNLTKLKTLELASDIDLYVNSLQKLQWLSRLTLLRYLDLSGVDLSKATNWMQIVSNLIPDFRKCIALAILNLGYNSLTGNIPTWMDNGFSGLGALILRRNRLVGEIPVSLCELANLQILDLAINNISGVIPNCVSNFTAMTGQTGFSLSFIHPWFPPSEEESAIISWKRDEQRFKETVRLVKFIDLSSNELSGEIPDEISSLTGLGSLDLSNNNLSGSIVSEIGELTALQLLDLSNNHLTGVIPASLAKVSSLGILDLSNNNLSGEIPLSTQLQSFNASSYTGNPGLCGAPLPNCSGDQEPVTVLNGDSNSVRDSKHDEYGIFPGLYISVVLGFIIGFWGVCGTLVIKQSWRHAYFRLLERMNDRLNEIATTIIDKVWRRL